MRYILFLVLFFTTQPVMAQKKPLDHSVYDSWQSIVQKLISNDGKWVVYTIDPQEGDNELVIQSAAADAVYKKSVARGYNAVITEDSRYVIFRIKPFFKETREAKIKNLAVGRQGKMTEEMPKDSLGIVELGKDSVWRKAAIKGFKTPEKSFGWLAYHLEKPADAKPKADNKKVTDSLNKIIDSLKAVITSMPKGKAKGKDDSIVLIDELDGYDAEGDEATASPEAGTELRLRNLKTGNEKSFKNVVEYLFSKNGQKLLLEQSRDPKDSLSKIMVLLYDLNIGIIDTLSRGGNDFKNFVFSDDGSQVAYLAERDAGPKDLEKYYKVWYFKEGMDSASVLVDKNSVGMVLGMTISENATPGFSKSGKRIFFGVAPIQAPKDTSLIEMDLVKLDVWHYNDDYLQTVQLSRLQRDLQKSFLSVCDFEKNTILQLASEEIPTVFQTNEGDGETFVGVTDVGKRLESQWTGNTKKDIYAIDVKTGNKTLIKKDMLGVISPNYVSPTGKYIMWYDNKAKNYFAWDGDRTRNITAKIKVPLYDEENDSPVEPSPYGIMGWQEGDSVVYVYDKYDIWRIGLGETTTTATMFTAERKNKIASRFIQTDPDAKSITAGQKLLFRKFNETTKNSSLVALDLNNTRRSFPYVFDAKFNIGGIVKSKNTDVLIYTKENYKRSPDIYVGRGVEQREAGELASNQFTFLEKQLSSINPQQKDYNWGSAELYKWKTFKGKSSEGILYKPEDFDPSKKYPLILYFYEKLSDGLNNYIPPAPTPSRLNISFFVSRGYLVFAPDIRYTIGHPAQSAYDYIVSAAKDLAKHKWVDAKNIGIQGQSWGGLQVAQLITMTDMFKAAWAGAPVANMTSAYGGIRWESGASRQFQYEKTQSRIGATLWEKPQLYIESSPLFHLPKVKTPLVIMANDADGAVPWYQGIELFTGMRRLWKKVWMLNYNGEAHNLIQRKNRKDIQIRQQQFFDWLLKGDKPAKWITEGVPAVKKGKDWGLEIIP
ncbi:alpha/beta hydrolase family protein [Terrimonas alba]|uniref:alpha/beta hydrolase family protein n=1 Tax=Terrimonas alba TaxID=3349636 RepID=UPI0035F47AA3